MNNFLEEPCPNCGVKREDCAFECYELSSKAEKKIVARQVDPRYGELDRNEKDTVDGK